MANLSPSVQHLTVPPLFYSRAESPRRSAHRDADSFIMTYRFIAARGQPDPRRLIGLVLARVIHRVEAMGQMPNVQLKRAFVLRAVDDARLGQATKAQVRVLEQVGAFDRVRERLPAAEQASFDRMLRTALDGTMGSSTALREAGQRMAAHIAKDAAATAKGGPGMCLPTPRKHKGTPGIEKYRRIINDLAPLVEEATGLSLDVSQIDLNLMTSAEFEDESDASTIALLNQRKIDHDIVTNRKCPLLQIFDWADRRRAVAAYLHSTRKLIIISDCHRCNDEMRRSTVLHELVHAAQFQNWHRLADAVDDSLAQVYRFKGEYLRDCLRDESCYMEQHLDCLKDAEDRCAAYECFTEGHATLFETAFTQGRFLGAAFARKTMGDRLANFISIRLRDRNDHPDRPYYLGRNRLSKVTPEDIHLIGSEPALCEVLFRTKGEVVIPYGEHHHDRSTLEAACERLRKLNPHQEDFTVRWKKTTG